MHLEIIKQMSIHDMEKIIFQIMTDNGMSEDEADDTIDNMSTSDMENYFLDAE